jgi:hypothetical protein
MVTAAIVLTGGVAAMAFVHVERSDRPTLTAAALPSSTSATASAVPPPSSTAHASTQAAVSVPYYGTITASGAPGSVPFT